MNNTLKFSLLCAVATLGGCKPQGSGNDASLKTLDNFARDDGTAVKTYFCGIAMNDGLYKELNANDKKIADTKIIVPGNDKELKYAVAGALAAVPRAMQTVFFAAKGKIRVVDDAKKECTKSTLTDAEKKFASENAKDAGGNFSFDGCWQLNGGKVEVILSKDKRVIHHGLIRLMTYVYTQFFTKNLAAMGDKNPLKSGVERFEKQRKALGDALLEDLAAISKAKAAPYASYAKSDRGGYENVVFSEAIDSAYCSASSRAVFEKQFPRTYKAFSEGELSLLKDFGKPLY